MKRKIPNNTAENTHRNENKQKYSWIFRQTKFQNNCKQYFTIYKIKDFSLAKYIMKLIPPIIRGNFIKNVVILPCYMLLSRSLYQFLRHNWICGIRTQTHTHTYFWFCLSYIYINIAYCIVDSSHSLDFCQRLLIFFVNNSDVYTFIV